MSALGIALLGIGLLVLGVGIGFYLARLGQSVDNAKLEEVETEFDDYRQQVTEHFGKTAEQIHTIGQQYRDLYEHLAAGSETLCRLDAEAEPPFPRVAQDIEEPVVEDKPVVEEVLVAAASTATAAVIDEEPEPADSSADDVEMAAVEGEDVEKLAEDMAIADDSGDADREEHIDLVATADEADTEADDVAVDEPASDEAVAVSPEAPDDVDLEDERVSDDVSDESTPDNVVELIPRAEDEADEDAERNIR